MTRRKTPQEAPEATPAQAVECRLLEAAAALFAAVAAFAQEYPTAAGYSHVGTESFTIQIMGGELLSLRR
jgi:hypothetical protein